MECKATFDQNDISVANKTIQDVKNASTAKLGLEALNSGYENFFSQRGGSACGKDEITFKDKVIEGLRKEDPAALHDVALEFARKGYSYSKGNEKADLNVDHSGVKESELTNFIDKMNDDGFQKRLAEEVKPTVAAGLRTGYDLGFTVIGADRFLPQAEIVHDINANWNRHTDPEIWNDK